MNDNSDNGFAVACPIKFRGARLAVCAALAIVLIAGLASCGSDVTVNPAEKKLPDGVTMTVFRAEDGTDAHTEFTAADGTLLLTAKGEDEAAYVPFWAELSDALNEDSVTSWADVAALAAEDYAVSGSQFISWNLMLEQQSTHTAYFDSGYTRLSLNNVSGHSARITHATTVDAVTVEPRDFASLFTVPAEEAQARVVEYIQNYTAPSPGSEPYDLAALAAAFDPERFYLTQSALIFFYPSGLLDSGLEVTFYIPCGS